MKIALAFAIAAIGLAACAPNAAENGDAGRILTMEDAEIFPAARTLQRPEDGVQLENGALLVADQRYGLALVTQEGVVQPFGNFAAAGYRFDLSGNNAAPNGVSMERDGAHVLVADIVSGAIYRVDIKAETTTKIYQHAYGVNTAIRDSSGALWFTQSTRNAGPESEARMFAAVDKPMSDGALYRIAPHADDEPQPAPEIKAEGIRFANGFVLDEARGMIYVSETMGDRVLAFTTDFRTGDLGDRRVLAEIVGPDNLERKDTSHLWAASPIRNEILEIDIESGKVRTVFSPASKHRDQFLTEWGRRGAAGETRIDLLSPDLMGEMPGLTTGVILPGEGGVFYVTGLGDAIVRVNQGK